MFQFVFHWWCVLFCCFWIDQIKFARRVENPEFLESKEDLLDSIEQAVERRHAEIVEATRVIDELQTNLSMAKEFEMVLNETGKLLQYKSTPLFSVCFEKRRSHAVNVNVRDRHGAVRVVTASGGDDGRRRRRRARNEH
jgi:hypothetical protein